MYDGSDDKISYWTSHLLAKDSNIFSCNTLKLELHFQLLIWLYSNKPLGIKSNITKHDIYINSSFGKQVTLILHVAIW